jgi:hypothetical protein
MRWAKYGRRSGRGGTHSGRNVSVAIRGGKSSSAVLVSETEFPFINKKRAESIHPHYKEIRRMNEKCEVEKSDMSLFSPFEKYFYMRSKYFSNFSLKIQKRNGEWHVVAEGSNSPCDPPLNVFYVYRRLI